MTESIDLQISAFLDDELSLDECMFLVKRLERDPESRRKTLRYAAIRGAVRGELLDPDPDVLRRRIGAALEGVHLPVRAEPQAAALGQRLFGPAIGAGIAASVAVVALLALNSGRNSVESTNEAAVAEQMAPAETQPDVTPTYIVPVRAGEQPFIRLTNYLVQHNQFTPAIRRASMNASVVGEQHVWRGQESAPVE
jgi:negative regulator of sigma E activity